MSEAYKPTDAHELFVCLNKFIGDNSRSNSVELRWIAAEAGALHALVREWKAGGMKSLRPEDRQSLADFRLAEIQQEQWRLDKAREALESEAKKLRNNKAA
jgi:hypothetical protein